MYQIKEKQERFYEDKLTIDEVKKELGSAINEEHKRINVDSAKKKAVLQHMDYDGFHQMVLGANLKPIKRGEAEKIYNQNKSSINFVASYGQIVSGGGPGYDEEAVKRLFQMNLEEQL